MFSTPWRMSFLQGSLFVRRCSTKGLHWVGRRLPENVCKCECVQGREKILSSMSSAGRFQLVGGIAGLHGFLQKLDDVGKREMREDNGSTLRIVVLRNLDVTSATVGARLENDAFAHCANLALDDVEGDSRTVVEGRNPLDGSCEALDGGGICDGSIRGGLFQQHVQPLTKKG